MISRDVQNERSENRFILTRVGVTDVKKPVRVRRPDRVTTLTVDLDVFVDLPSSMKGSHMSRNLEAIGEIVDSSVRQPVAGLEDLSLMICRRLLDRHEYASYSEARASAYYFLEKETLLGKKSLERYKLVARAEVKRGNDFQTKKSIGVEVVGMTTCPCAMETVSGGAKNLSRIEQAITHNQRNRTFVMMDVPEGMTVEADDLVQVVEDSMSSPTFEILKREDEAELVKKAHLNPRFVEDVVRGVLMRILERYADLPDFVQVQVKSESEESIHKHNAFAERVTTLGELRR
ncbi:MAG: GTP cyclohydrolase MptA [Thermoplasmata archaeon]